MNKILWGIDMDSDYYFPTKLKEAREACSFTQDEVAQLLALSVMQISNYECGKNVPTLMMLLMLCALYDITPNDLLGFAIDE